MPRKPPPPQVLPVVRQHPPVVPTTMYFPSHQHQHQQQGTMTSKTMDHPMMPSIMPTTTKGKKNQTSKHLTTLLLPPMTIPPMIMPTHHRSTPSPSHPIRVVTAENNGDSEEEEEKKQQQQSQHPEMKHHPRHIPFRHHHHHHSTDHQHRNWRLSHDIHQCRRKVFQQIMTCLYQMMNVEEVALRYENIIYDGAYSQYDYEDKNSLPERVQHLFSTDAAPRFLHDLASSSLEFSLQHRPLARASMERALSLSSLLRSDHHQHHHNNIILPPLPQPQQQKQQQPAVRLLPALSSQQQPAGGEVKDEKNCGNGLEASYQTTSLPDNPLPTVTEMEPADDDVDVDNEIDAIINNIPSEDGTFGIDDDISDDNGQPANGTSDNMGDGASTCPSPPAAKRPKYDDEKHHNSATPCDVQGPASTAPEEDIAATAKSSSLLLSSTSLPKLSTNPGHKDRHGAVDGGAGSFAVTTMTPLLHGASTTTIHGSSQQRYTPPPSRLFHRNKRKSMDYHRSSTQIVMERKVQRLMELYHAARCSHNNNNDGSSQKCPHSKYCTDMKRLWTHMETCRNNFCTVKHCYTSRVVLAHYKTCTNSICQICQPVRHYITSSSSSSATTTSRIINSNTPANTASIQKKHNHHHDARTGATATPPPQDDDDDNHGSHHDHHTSRCPANNVTTSHRNAVVAIASG